MKRHKTKQIVMSLMGLAACRISFAGCYPLIPAYFAAGCLSGGSRMLLGAMMLAGMGVFLPITEMVKYFTALLVTMVVIWLAEWANKACYGWVGALAAGASTTLVSIFGGLLDIKTRTPVLIAVLEGIFIFGASMLLERVLHRFMGWQLIKETRSEGAPQERENREERLLTYARSFQGLSAVFNKMDSGHDEFSPEEMGRIQNEITGKLCASCDSCALCWESPTSPLYSCLSGLIESIRLAGRPDEKVQEKLLEYCPYTGDMIEEAVNVFERARLNLAWYNRLVENREVIAQQLDAMAYIMEDCARENRDIGQENKRSLSELGYRIRERGFKLHDVRLYEKENGRWSLHIRVSAKRGCIPLKEVTKAVNLALERPMMVHRDMKTIVGKDETRIIYEEDTALKTIQGVARLVKDGASISGDNFSFLEQEDGRLVMSLSDGMGSGARACKESELAIELIEKFLEAGFGVDTAIRMMNSAMVIKGEEDLFSTLDMSVIDLYSGRCELYKIGAAATFIKRREEVECILSTSLPAGVYHKLDVERDVKQLSDGEFLVMVTDGVLEYLHVPHPEETMQEIIESIDTNNPGTMAKKILERVLLFTGGRVADDMTVLVSGIWEK